MAPWTDTLRQVCLNRSDREKNTMHRGRRGLKSLRQSIDISVDHILCELMYVSANLDSKRGGKGLGFIGKKRPASLNFRIY